jgi:inorganic pyrophosphatase
MDKEWIGAISALAGVIVTSVAEAFRTGGAFKREKTWAVRDERRAYLEELWTRLDELQSGYETLFNRARHTQEWVSMHAQEAEKPVLPWSRIRQIVALYLSEYGVVLNSLEMAGSELDEAIDIARGSTGVSVKNLPNARDVQDNLFQAVEQFRDGLEPIRKKITDETRAITDARYASAALPKPRRR